MKTFPNVISVQDLQRNYRKALDMAKSTKEPLFILKNNAPEAVVLDMESWGGLVDEKQRREMCDALMAIRVYKKEKTAGTLKKLSGSLADLL